MSSQLFAICFNATRPADLARFWSGLLGWDLAGGPDDGIDVLPPDADGFRIRFLPGREPKTGQNRAHFDLTSASQEEQRRTVARALELGGKHIDVGQLPEEGHVVLADPDGNELCVIEAGNKFLADTGFVGALACDGTREVGYFWSEALRWPLVWDQDEETAIQSPNGGTKITWGGPRSRTRRARTGCSSSWRSQPARLSTRRSTAWSHSARRAPRPAKAMAAG